VSTIQLSRRHGLGAVEAREKVCEVAEVLKARFGADYRWEGDCLHLKRSGVDGIIDISTEGQVMVNVKLGIPLRPMKSAIESSILKGFDKVFDTGNA